MCDVFVHALSFDDDIEITGVVDAFEGITDAIASSEIHVLLLNMGLPGMDGVQSLAEIGSGEAGVGIVLVGRDADIPLGVESVLSNPYDKARAFLSELRASNAERLCRVVHAVADGLAVLDTPRMHEVGPPELVARPGIGTFTSLELEILECIAGGKSDRAVAHDLCLDTGPYRTWSKPSSAG